MNCKSKAFKYLVGTEGLYERRIKSGSDVYRRLACYFYQYVVETDVVSFGNTLSPAKRVEFAYHISHIAFHPKSFAILMQDAL